MTILELKIQAANEKEKDATSFLAEKSGLQDLLEKWDQMLKDDLPKKEVWEELAQWKNGLIAVNSLLWDAEDMLRALPDTEMSKIAMLARRIAKLNDSRSDLVQKVGKIYGVGGEEKIYGVSLGRQATGVSANKRT